MRQRCFPVLLHTTTLDVDGFAEGIRMPLVDEKNTVAGRKQVLLPQDR